MSSLDVISQAQQQLPPAAPAAALEMREVLTPSRQRLRKRGLPTISMVVEPSFEQVEQVVGPRPSSIQLDSPAQALVWSLCMLGPITIIMSQKILFGSRKMGTLWEESGKPTSTRLSTTWA